MLIVAPATSSAKLRRSGMSGTGDIVRAGSNIRRSYGACPGVGGTTTINTALLAELGRPPVLKAPCKVQALRLIPIMRIAWPPARAVCVLLEISRLPVFLHHSENRGFGQRKRVHKAALLDLPGR